MSEILALVDDALNQYGEKCRGNENNYLEARASLLSAIAKIEQERDEYKGSVTLWHSCMERALKIWQEANPELDYWPDGADNIVWLLERLAEAEEDANRLAEDLTSRKLQVGQTSLDLHNARLARKAAG